MVVLNQMWILSILYLLSFVLLPVVEGGRVRRQDPAEGGDAPPAEQVAVSETEVTETQSSASETKTEEQKVEMKEEVEEGKKDDPQVKGDAKGEPKPKGSPKGDLLKEEPETTDMPEEDASGGKMPFVPYDSFPLPYYDPLRMTPEHFLAEVQEFFTLRGIPQNKWLLFVFRMFLPESDTYRWWRETRGSVKSWPAFSEAFILYETSAESKDVLLLKLFSKRQSPFEPFESFAWDVNSLFRRIEVKVEVQEVIDRILNSCIPEISVYLRQHDFESIAALNSKAREVISDINKMRRKEGKYLFRARQTDPVFPRAHDDAPRCAHCHSPDHATEDCPLHGHDDDQSIHGHDDYHYDY